MKTISVDFVKLLRESYNKKNVEELENLGYSLDNQIEDINNMLIYKDERIKSIIVVIYGMNITKDFNFLKIPSKINEFNDKIKYGEINIKKIIEIYNDYNIIFIGHSLGGFIINKNLNNKEYNCYTYNACFIGDNSKKNIKNYRTNGDILSLGLIGKETETIDINIWNYLLKNNLNLISYLIESHYTNILDINNKRINIEIPVYVKE
jgi:hypothetical protein